MADSVELDIDDLFSPAKGWVPPPTPPLHQLSGQEILNTLSLHCKTVSTVYRLERNGLGPYTLNDNWKTDSHTPRTGRFTPGTDMGFSNAFSLVEPNPKIREEWFSRLKKKSEHQFLFGFSSLEQLLRWFYCHKEVRTLFDRGYKIEVYKNVIGFDSSSQVIFINSDKSSQAYLSEQRLSSQE